MTVYADDEFDEPIRPQHFNCGNALPTINVDIAFPDGLFRVPTMPQDVTFDEAINIACPACESGERQPCRELLTGFVSTAMHVERLEFAARFRDFSNRPNADVARDVDDMFGPASERLETAKMRQQFSELMLESEKMQRLRKAYNE